jgi:hypothetical protein
MEKEEKKLENWHVTEMSVNWKIKREMAKRKCTEAIAAARREKEAKLLILRERHADEVRLIEDTFDVAEAKIREALNDELLAIAREQDDFMDRFRNYAASLPKDQPDPYNVDAE